MAVLLEIHLMIESFASTTNPPGLIPLRSTTLCKLLEMTRICGWGTGMRCHRCRNLFKVAGRCEVYLVGAQKAGSMSECRDWRQKCSAAGERSREHFDENPILPTGYRSAQNLPTRIIFDPHYRSAGHVNVVTKGRGTRVRPEMYTVE